MNVIKRDGVKQAFDSEKIKQAVLKAFKEVDGNLESYALEKAENIAKYIFDFAKDKEMTVEEIQDLVEHGLMSCKRKDVAKAYILYRDARTKAREYKTNLIQAVKRRINTENVNNQNANMDEYSFGGRLGMVNNDVLKQYALDYCMSEMSRNNHLNNEVYIHDLDMYAVGAHNCLTIPFDDLLANGFTTRQVDIRPAQSISSALQLVAVIFQLQSLQQFGGVSASHLDWTLVPYIRKSFLKHFKDGMKYINKSFVEFNDNFWDTYDTIENKELKMHYPEAYNYALDMTKKETYQAVEGMYHNLNTLQSRSGCQLKIVAEII